MAHPNDEKDVQLFKEFLRINTMHPNPNLSACVAWLEQQAKTLDMEVQIHEFEKDLPVVIVSKIGRDPTLPSVVLNCHMDVVPVVPEKWTALPKGETPFTAWEDPSNGKIYARGSQDMKCVGAQYLCALRRMKETNFLRTIHTLWVPDEEIGGQRGMKPFVQSSAFKNLKAGVVMDEGLSFEENIWVIHYGERTPLWIEFSAVGPMGHAAKLIEDTAMERLSHVIAAMATRRHISVQTLAEDKAKSSGDVTTVNWTMAQAGVTNDGGKTYAYNVIPSRARVVFDCRVTYEDYWPLIKDCEALCAKYDLKYEIVNGDPKGPSQLSSTTGVWYKTVERAITKNFDATPKPAIFPAATDSRFVRNVGVPAFGFSPMRGCPSLLHDHNEYLPRATYLEGVRVYCDLIPALANLPAGADRDSKL